MKGDLMTNAYTFNCLHRFVQEYDFTVHEINSITDVYKNQYVSGILNPTSCM